MRRVLAVMMTLFATLLLLGVVGLIAGCGNKSTEPVTDRTQPYVFKTPAEALDRSLDRACIRFEKGLSMTLIIPSDAKGNHRPDNLGYAHEDAIRFLGTTEYMTKYSVHRDTSKGPKKERYYLQMVCTTPLGNYAGNEAYKRINSRPLPTGTVKPMEPAHK